MTKSYLFPALTMLVALPAWAIPEAPEAFCANYPSAPDCSSGVTDCSTCHTTPPARNAFGAAIEAELLPGQARPLSADDFIAALPSALSAIEALDLDGDGVANLEEILAGSDVLDAGSVPADDACELQPGQLYNVCDFDALYVFDKLHLDFCGRRSTLTERDTFMDAADQLAALDDALDACLDTEYWRGRDGVLWQIANRKILPLQAIKGGEDSGPIPLGDYFDDYAYFAFTQSDDTDAREVLTGQYHVVHQVVGGVTEYTVRENVQPLQDVFQRGQERAQLVAIDKRAGMLTHRWNLVVNTMFTPMPRTTAAAAYRSYLGLDLSKLEGLAPIEGEPVDYDNKGVQQAACARCHATLDPLTYPFSRYQGIGGGSGNMTPFSYVANRQNNFASEGPEFANTPEAGFLFGEPVQDLVEWAAVAANSDAFAEATVKDYWKVLMGESPRPTELAEFRALAQDFTSVHNYRVERMLHALIKTEAYSVP